MSKPTILFSKWGAAFWTREAREARGDERAVRGEQGCTEGMLKHLLKNKDVQIIYYGRYRGEPLPGLTVIQPLSSLSLDEYATAAEQDAALDEDFNRLPEADYRFALCNLGTLGSWFTVRNAAGAGVRLSDLKFRAPWADAIQRLELPFALVNNDVRNAAAFRHGEINTTHPAIRPIAWLDQTGKAWTKYIQGVKWYIKPIYCKAETWTDLPPRIKVPKSRQCVLVAHAHIKTGNRQAGRNQAWRAILGGKVPPELEVYGEGWEHYTGPRSHIRFCGLTMDAAARYAESVCAPFVAPVTGYATNKPAFMAQQDCVPIPFGRGEPFTANQILPLNSPYRVEAPNDLDRVVREINKSAMLRLDLLHRTVKAMRRDFSVLDNLIDDLLDGMKPGWFEKWGGMRRV